MKRFVLILLAMLTSGLMMMAQEKVKGDEIPDPSVDEYKPLTVKLNEDGSKFLRFVMWGQFWLTGQNNAENEFRISPSLRRIRILALAQVSPRFLILMHFGLNNLDEYNMNPLGNQGDGPQMFMHGVWTEFAIVQEYFHMGAGLHYWNGISRITNASTLNFMTLDNYRRAWPVLGLTDQFARHIGIYAKGLIGRFGYRVAVNSPLVNSLDVSEIPQEPAQWKNQTLYTGKKEFRDDAAWSYSGYFEFMFFDKESYKLPFKVNTYLGKKKILNVGAGFYLHPKGTITYNEPTELNEYIMTQNNVSHFAFDVFYDTPLGTGGLTAYGAFYVFDYGPEYKRGQTYGTGNSLLVEAGYLLPKFSNKISLQPYVAFNTANFEAFDNPGNELRTGINLFLNGHHAKLTLEYTTTQTLYNNSAEKPGRANKVILQAQVFL